MDADAAVAPAQVRDRGRAVRARRDVGAGSGRRRGDAGHRRPHHADLDGAPARFPFRGTESRAARPGRQDRNRDPLDRGYRTDGLIRLRYRTVSEEWMRAALRAPRFDVVTPP